MNSGKKIKIALIGYESFTARAEKYIPFMKDVDVITYHFKGDNHLILVQKLQDDEIDAIITGQIGYNQLKDKVNIPIILFRVSLADALKALNDALTFKEKTVALLYPFLDDFGVDFKTLAKFVGLNIVHFPYNNSIELMDRIAEINQQGIKVMIGTTIGVNYSKAFGINGVEIYSVENMIYASIEKAKEVAEKIREERSNEIFRDLIISNSNEGIVYIDDLGIIRVFNDEALRLFKFEKLSVIGLYINEIISELKLMDTIRTGNIDINSIETIRNINLSINRMPIVINNKVIGVVSTFQNIENIEKISYAIKRNKKENGFIAKYTFDNIVGESPKMQNAIELSKKYARSELPILVEGETGTGKEMFVQSIHNHSDRRSYPFVAINCASLPENLLESELFGYESGAFTGANKGGKKGLFEIADGGSILLDEINSMSINFQSKLLRVIEENEIIRIGGNNTIPINVRIIATSNESMISMVDKGEFRQDLYFRIGTLRIKIPPLRDRISDLPYLIEEICNNINLHKEYDLKHIYNEISNNLNKLNFPGNIRELKMYLNRFFILLDESKIYDSLYIKHLIDFCTDDLFKEVDNDLDTSQSLSIIQQNEKKIIMNLLKECKYNKSQVAKRLGIGRNTLYRKMKNLEIYDW